MKKSFLLTTSLMTLFLVGCTTTDNTNNTNATAVALPSATTTPARSVPPRHDDKEFAMKVAQDGMAEVELGRMAAQKGQSPDVKRFGQRMVTDHSKAGTELKQLVSSKGITLPAEINEDQKAGKDKLAKLSGAEFDREYMSMMVLDHDKAVAAFQEESSEGSDADIKAFATKTLPTLQEHQRLAKETRDKLK